MKFAGCKNHKESIGLLFWQSSMLWQRKIKQALQPYDLTHTQFVILADVMTVSSTVRLLEKKGLIFRTPHKTDTRANSISNTEQGRNYLRKAVIAVESVDKEFFFADVENNAQFRLFLTDLLRKNMEWSGSPNGI